MNSWGANGRSEDALARAERELSAFNQRTQNASDAEKNSEVALESARRQLSAVEATTEERVTGGWEQLERNLARLADVKVKLSASRQPRGGGRPAPAADVKELEERRLKALDAALLLKVRLMLDAELEVARQGDVRWVLEGEVERRAESLKRNLGAVQSPAAKVEAKLLLASLERKVGKARSLLGDKVYGFIRPVEQCRDIGKDELSWTLRVGHGGALVAWKKRYLELPITKFEKPSDAPLHLHRDVLDASRATEELSSCTSKRPPTDFAEEAALSRKQLLAATVVSDAWYGIREVAEMVAHDVEYRKPLSKVIATQRAELSRRLRAGSAALARYKSALGRASGGSTSVISKDLDVARRELAEARAVAAELSGKRAALRRAEDELAERLNEVVRVAERAGEAAKASRDLAKDLRAHLEARANAKTTDPAELARRGRSAAVLLSLKETVAFTDATLTQLLAVAGKLPTVGGIGRGADYPKRLATAQKEDAVVAADQGAAVAQLTEAEALAKSQRSLLAAKCDLRRVDWGKLDFPHDPAAVAPTETEYGDTNGDGVLEAYLLLRTANADFAELHVFEMGPDCRPRHLDSKECGLFPSGRLVDSRYVVDSAYMKDGEDYASATGRMQVEYRLSGGKLKQVK